MILDQLGAPLTNQIAPNGDFDPSTEIQLQGRILDRKCQPISNAVVDVWYAGGNPGMCNKYLFFQIQANALMRIFS